MKIMKHTLCHLILVSSYFFTLSSSPIQDITVFVHGTVWPSLALLSPIGAYHNLVKPQNWYSKCLTRLRKTELLHHDSILLEQGMHKLDIDAVHNYDQQPLSTEFLKKGAYHIVGAHHMLTQLVGGLDHHYYAFGYTGLLSEEHRKQTSIELYEQLILLAEEYKAAGYTPRITLCAYSHGGNVSLYLAEQEDMLHHQLKIEKLILLATPIQPETAVFSIHPLFKRVYHFFSLGDGIQGNDDFSISSKLCFTTFGDIFTIVPCYHEYQQKFICDIKVLIEGNETVYGHYDFWYLRRRTIEKADCLAIKTRLPFPLVSYLPIIIDMIDQLPEIHHKLGLNFIHKEQQLYASITDFYTDEQLKQSTDLLTCSRKILAIARDTWLPLTKSHQFTKLKHAIAAAVLTRFYAA